MKINHAKSSGYDAVKPRNIVDYIRSYSDYINQTVNPEKADVSSNTTMLANCNKTQLKLIAAELETVMKRLEYITTGRY